MEQIHENTPQKTLKSKNKYRDRMDLLRSRANLLTGQDRLLITMYLENGNSFRQMARLAGINQANIARRIRRLTKRLIDGEYIKCLQNRDKFTRLEMKVARDYFLTALSIKRIADKRHCSYYRIREILKKIQRLVAVIDGDNKP